MERRAAGDRSRLRRAVTFAATVLTLYPEMFPGPLGVSLAGRALEEGKWSLDTVQIRDFAIDKHRTVDDTPAGGGAGMVLRADVLAAAVDHALSLHPDCPVLAMTPARQAAHPGARPRACGRPRRHVLCGRFEGFDERIFAGARRSRRSRSATSSCRAASPPR